MTDPWIQRFDERRDEDDRYDRVIAQERRDREAEKEGERPDAPHVLALRANSYDEREAA